MSIPHFALLTAAGVAAGLTGTVAGLASLFSYPALLAAGLSPTTANVTNTVSLAIGNITVVPSSRRELAGQSSAVLRLGLVVVLGSAAGAALLLATPPGVFQRVVPFLVGGASVAILVRRPARDTLGSGEPKPPESTTWLTVLGMFAVALYSGYFAAASGVVMLALLLATTSESLLRSNALKNVLVGVADLVAAAGFVLFGTVSWLNALPLALGLLLGSWLGPPLARSLPTALLRVGIALAGLALAVKLAVEAY
ncbi:MULTISPECIES: sulfite exporter TauE/SafE family protein [Streptomyces]|uniref:Probable membrane transporter protein n=2 Tax=Streptomyces rimosus subsp. rimosus TaxID=132474 RepID=L8ERK7_STRR1|nr:MULTISPECIES: sulfite exporter TauE/SafE family protein [Streptomyces]KOG71319.1 transporter [Kitasatospora aureofaciens]MYT43013.1 TSUP family transporter [Streptomyces sp. SID5471]KEF08930.1 transporter [Streptomyces rimosus]KOT39184.1 transporter [Streptomyces sp. NRRL WC-3701]KOT40232.1 transporter [Streptomyces rimosus subsp. rimosus]